MKSNNIVILAFLTAILFISQIALSFLPNIEIVSLLIILYTQFFKKKVFLIIYLFALLEGLLYGFGIWWIMYLYVWSILAFIVLFLCTIRRNACANASLPVFGSLPVQNKTPIFWAIISGFYGLFFGILCAIPYFVSGGWAAGFGYWISGIPFDIIHCIGNLTVTLVLYRPLFYILQKLNLNYPLL